jgi:hypothetical protein
MEVLAERRNVDTPMDPSRSPHNSPTALKAVVTPRPLAQQEGEENIGGAKGIRTPDLLRAKQMLYQLSYRPKTRENRE